MGELVVYIRRGAASLASTPRTWPPSLQAALEAERVRRVSITPGLSSVSMCTHAVLLESLVMTGPIETAGVLGVPSRHSETPFMFSVTDATAGRPKSRVMSHSLYGTPCTDCSQT
jgi:hypothetical protein